MRHSTQLNHTPSAVSASNWNIMYNTALAQQEDF